MKTKTIPIPCNDINDRIEIICAILRITAAPEIAVIRILYSFDNGGPVLLDSDTRRSVCMKNKLKYETFSVSLSRLMKKKVVNKVGNMYVLNKIFANINDADVLVINWQKPKPETNNDDSKVPELNKA